MLTKADIEARRPVIVKWDKALVQNGNVTEGVIAGQADEFIPRIEQESKLLSMLRYVEMDGETQDIQALRVRPKLQNGNKLTGGAQIDDLLSLNETLPGILKETLVAQFFTAFTKIPKTFMRTNIEKEGFLAKYESLLAPACAADAEVISIFGKIPSSGQTASGYEALNGILAQLDEVKTYYDTNHATDAKLPMGKFDDIDLTANILPQIDAMLIQFTKQRGKRSLAKILVSSTIEAKMIAEASKRETVKGDDLFFNDNGNLVFRGREVIQLDALDNPENGYGDTVIIMNPDSVGYGPVMEAESEADYKQEMKAYLTSVDFMFDVGIIFPEDVLYAEVTSSPSAGD